MLEQKECEVPIILETESLTKKFGELVALDQVDFVVKEGELRAVIGPNGAGKTTLFNVVTGRFPPTAGKVIFQGRDLTRLRPEEIPHLGLARTFQITNIFSELTTLENVRIAAQSRLNQNSPFTHVVNLPEANERAKQILKKVGLESKSQELAGTLAHGEQRFLEIGITLALDPILILFDEPTAGMSPGETNDTVEFLREISEDLTVIIVEHDMDVIMNLADTITVLHQGRILAEGSPEDIRANKEVQEAYLGGM